MHNLCTHSERTASQVGMAQIIAPSPNVTTEQPTVNSEEIARNRRKGRKLVRFDSEQALNLFLNKSNKDDNSSEDDL